VKEGYIVDFSIEYSDSFNKDEINIEEGPSMWMVE
jgi:hypothetical protein